MHRVLLVDDSENDAVLTKRKLSQAGLTGTLVHILESQRAMAYLNGDEGYADRAKYPIPTVVFLDLKMPVLDGFQLLKWIKSQPHLANVIVIVLTGMKDVKYIERAYRLGAQSFLSKEANLEEVENLVRFLNNSIEPSNVSARPQQTKRAKPSS